MSLLLLYIQHGHTHLIKARKKSLPHRVSKQFQSSKVVVFESGKASKLSKTRSGLAQHSGRSTHGLRLRSAPHDLNCTFHVGARQTRMSAKWLNCLFRTTHARTQREASEGTMEQEKEHWHQIYKPSLKISAKKKLAKNQKWHGPNTIAFSPLGISPNDPPNERKMCSQSPTLRPAELVFQKAKLCGKACPTQHATNSQVSATSA